jgi:hypothetical protein
MKTMLIASVGGFLALQVVSVARPIVLSTFTVINAALEFANRVHQ